MAMGIVSDDDFKKEITKVLPSLPARSSVPSTAQIKPINNGGRNEGDVNVPESLRKVLGETAQTEGRKSALNFAMQCGLSESSLSAYTNGANSTNEYGAPKSPELRNHVKSVKERLAIKARNKLNHTLNAITPEKLENAKLRDLAGVATAMSSVVRQMEGDTNEKEDDGVKRPTVVIFAPRVRKEEEYETLVVND